MPKNTASPATPKSSLAKTAPSRARRPRLADALDEASPPPIDAVSTKAGIKPKPLAAPRKRPSASPASGNPLRSELLALLRDSLRIKVSTGDFTNPNSRKLLLMLDGEEVASAEFDVVQKEEYGC